MSRIGKSEESARPCHNEKSPPGGAPAICAHRRGRIGNSLEAGDVSFGHAAHDSRSGTNLCVDATPATESTASAAHIEGEIIMVITVDRGRPQLW
jgi:hypothetical protein